MPLPISSDSSPDSSLAWPSSGPTSPCAAASIDSGSSAAVAGVYANMRTTLASESSSSICFTVW